MIPTYIRSLQPAFNLNAATLGIGWAEKLSYDNLCHDLISSVVRGVLPFDRVIMTGWQRVSRLHRKKFHKN